MSFFLKVREREKMTKKFYSLSLNSVLTLRSRHDEFFQYFLRSSCVSRTLVSVIIEILKKVIALISLIMLSSHR